MTSDPLVNLGGMRASFEPLVIKRMTALWISDAKVIENNGLFTFDQHFQIRETNGIVHIQQNVINGKIAKQYVGGDFYPALKVEDLSDWDYLSCACGSEYDGTLPRRIFCHAAKIKGSRKMDVEARCCQGQLDLQTEEICYLRGYDHARIIVTANQVIGSLITGSSATTFANDVMLSCDRTSKFTHSKI